MTTPNEFFSNLGHALYQINILRQPPFQEDIVVANLYLGLRSTRPGTPGTRLTKIQDGVAEDLPLRLDLARHSPTGFDWGFIGEGSAQLALSILANAAEIDDLALLFHQAFSAQIIIALDRNEWRLTSEQVLR